MRKTLRHLLILLAVMTVSVAVMAGPIPLGFVIYNLTDPGFAEFDVINQTGPNSSGDSTWPVVDSISFSSLSLTVTDSATIQYIYGSGYFSLEPDGLSWAGPTVPDPYLTNPPLVMAVLTGTLSPTTFMLYDGSTFNAMPTFTAMFSDASGLQDGDFAIIYANPVVSGVPEPTTLVLVAGGLWGILGARRRRFLP